MNKFADFLGFFDEGEATFRVAIFAPGLLSFLILTQVQLISCVLSPRSKSGNKGFLCLVLIHTTLVEMISSSERDVSRKITKISLCLLIFSTLQSHALDEKKLPEKVKNKIAELREERRWENSPKGTLGLQVGSTQPTLELGISQQKDLAKELSYRPNIQNRLMTSLSYNGLGLAVTTTTPGMQNDPKIYGSSSSNDLILRFFGVKVSAEIFYQQNKSYYLENTHEVIPGHVDGQPMNLRPDMNSSYLGANLTYNLNEERFSMSGAFDYTRKQVRSGGAWLLLGSVSRENFQASDSFVPTSEQAGYGNFNAVRSIDLYGITAGAGGAYNYVYKNFNLAGLFGIAVGSQYSNFKLSGGSTSGTQMKTKGFAKFSIGYNGESFMMGIFSNMHNSSTSVTNADINITSLDTNIFVGYKFKDVHLTWIDEVIEKYWPLSSSEI